VKDIRGMRRRVMDMSMDMNIKWFCCRTEKETSLSRKERRHVWCFSYWNVYHVATMKRLSFASYRSSFLVYTSKLIWSYSKKLPSPCTRSSFQTSVSSSVSPQPPSSAALLTPSLNAFATSPSGGPANSCIAIQVDGSGCGSSVVGKPLRARDCAFVLA